MRKLIVIEWMSLDGVVQAPGAPDEDTSGGFKHGGWHLRYFDDLSRKWVVDNLNVAGGFLFGRRTYEGFAGRWPSRRVLAPNPRSFHGCMIRPPLAVCWSIS